MGNVIKFWKFKGEKLKDKRIAIFNNFEKYFHEQIVDNYTLDKRATILDLNQTLYVKKNKANSIIFHHESVTETISKYKEPLVLVFGSATKAGGGVVNGATAQEEDIALKTTWYFHVKNNPEYYNIEHSSLYYTDLALYVKNGLMLTDAYDFPITPQKISLIGCAAPNLSAMKQKNKSYNDKVLYRVVEKRLRAMFKFAEKEGHKTIIVGAWGCGVFGLSIERVALAYKNVLLSECYSGNVVFSIMDKLMYDTFKYIIEKDD